MCRLCSSDGFQDRARHEIVGFVHYDLDILDSRWLAAWNYCQVKMYAAPHCMTSGGSPPGGEYASGRFELWNLKMSCKYSDGYLDQVLVTFHRTGLERYTRQNYPGYGIKRNKGN